jgi:hypothetical protein
VVPGISSHPVASFTQSLNLRCHDQHDFSILIEIKLFFLQEIKSNADLRSHVIQQQPFSAGWLMRRKNKKKFKKKLKNIFFTFTLRFSRVHHFLFSKRNQSYKLKTK